VYDLIILPDHHGYARNAIVTFRIGQFVYDRINLGIYRRGIQIHTKGIAMVFGVWTGFFGWHSHLRNS
jgi:hypothetical protein